MHERKISSQASKNSTHEEERHTNSSSPVFLPQAHCFCLLPHVFIVKSSLGCVHFENQSEKHLNTSALTLTTWRGRERSYTLKHHTRCNKIVRTFVNIASAEGNYSRIPIFRLLGQTKLNFTEFTSQKV